VTGPKRVKMMPKKVVRTENTGYTCENGLWELMGKSRYV
jgi:hypothetical protein